MPAFVFPLDPLLEQRRRTERTLQRDVALLETRRRELEDLVRRRQADLAEGKRSLRDVLVGSLDAAALRLHAASAVQVMRQGHRLVLELAGTMERLAAARARLAAAARDRRALEILRERRHEAWRQAIERGETAALDELAVMAAARRSDDSVETRP